MDWRGLSKQQIEFELVERIETTRARYVALQESREAADRILRDASGSDGSFAVHQARNIAREALEALHDYQQAVKEFTDYTLRGKLTQD